MSGSSIRFAHPADLLRLAAIEDAADRLLIERLGGGNWAPAPSGAARGAAPGFVLVVADRLDTAAAIGFAHVVASGGEAHLEQLSVLPSSGRRGHGRALVLAALEEAERRGHPRLTLRTFADVPWNAPFYRTLGFEELEPDTRFQRDLVDVEERAELPRLGRRVLMAAALGTG